MKQFLITGGTGMVGSHLVNEIKKREAHITILTRSDKQSDEPKITYVNSVSYTHLTLPTNREV